MGLITTGFYFLSIGMAGYTIYFSSKIQRLYTFKFLRYFLSYIIFFYVFGFLNFTGRLLVSRIFIQDPLTLQTASQVVGVLATPSLFISFFFALRWIREMMGKETSAGLKSVYWAIQTLVQAAFFYGVADLIQNKSFLLAHPILRGVMALEILIIIAFLSQIYLGLKKLTNKIHRRLARTLAHIYLAGILVQLLITFWVKVPVHVYPVSLSYQVGITFIFFFLNIPALFFLYFFLKKHHGKLSFGESLAEGIADFYQRFKITQREQEIINHIVKGLTNEAIGDELFISTKTVKNNISNIYRKTGVQNRVQLTNLIRDYQFSQPR